MRHGRNSVGCRQPGDSDPASPFRGARPEWTNLEPHVVPDRGSPSLTPQCVPADKSLMFPTASAIITGVPGWCRDAGSSGRRGIVPRLVSSTFLLA